MQDKENLTKPIIAFIWQHAARYPRYLWGMLGVVPFAVLFNRFLPNLVVAMILDRLSRGDYDPTNWWGSFGGDLVLAVFLWVLGGVFIWRIVSWSNWQLEGRVTRDIAQESFNHLLKLGANFHANHFAGSLVSQVNKLMGAYVRVTDTTVFSVATLIWGIVFASIILLPRAPLFVALLLVFVAIYMAVAIMVSRKIRIFGAVHAETENKQTGELADSVTNVMAVKSFAASETENKRFGRATENTRTALRKLAHISIMREYAFTSIGNAINGLALLMTIIGIVVFKAELATVFLILSYTNTILIQLWDFSTSALRTYNRALGDAESMIKVLALQPEVQDPAHPEKPAITKGSIAFNHMDFTHPDQNDALFTDLQFSIAPSEKIGLVGHSGSGKTTLTKLLLRFNDIDGGEITIDGQNIAHLTQDDLRRHIAYVPQEPLLFHRSIQENIAYGKPDATEAEIVDAAKKAYSHEFIQKLPKGYDTLVGERGIKLSGGQKQRIAIARAILKDAPILVLDEATSALDSESEKLIQAALWKLMEGRTAIVIAHRLSTVQRMDRIVVLDDGKIVEEGSHSTLVKKKKGTYAALWKHQSGGFLEDL